MELEVTSGGLAVDIEIPVAPPEATLALAVVRGAQGPEGPAGPTGPKGDDGGGITHTQSTPASNWIVTHTLGRYPFSSEITIAGEVVHADVVYPDVYTAVVTFASPQSGSLKLT
jgi:hypothetical protein